MDNSALAEAELRPALDFLARTNRWFGGVDTVLKLFARWSRSWARAQPVTVLDVGAGSADIPVALAKWGRARGFDIRVTAIDATPAVAAAARAAAAREPRVEVVHADLFDFVRSGRRFDYVIASMLLHHIPDERKSAALLACDRLARRGVAFVDLKRSRAAYWAVRLVTRLFGERVTRHDGPLSVLKGFRAQELEALAREARLGYLETRRHRFFRLSLSGEKTVA